MSSNLPYKQAANVERRTWDKEAYEARAKARTDAAQRGFPGSSAAASAAAAGEKRPLSAAAAAAAGEAVAVGNADEPEKEEFVPAPKGRAGPERSQRAYVKARSARVDLEGKLGTSEIVNPDAVAVSGGGGAAAAAPGEEGGVSITDGVTKSSTGVGWHCKVCDCYLKDSLTYLDHINGRKHQRYLGYSMRVEKSTKNQVTGALAALAEEKRKNEQREAAAAMKSSSNPAEEDEEEGGNEFEDAVRKKDEEALRRKAERARKREERKRREEEEQEQEEEELGGGLDPDMAAMMGFSGFGGGNKN